MGRHDWYRNEKWNSEIEIAFRAKLKRARDKSQYLRIQADYLAPSYPDVAHKLLQEFFELNNPFDKTSAYNLQAHVYAARGETSKAVEAFRNSLREEAANPHIVSQTRLEFPWYVAVSKLSDHYDEAIEILGNVEALFAVSAFLAHGTLAMIAADRGHADKAIQHATLALAASDVTHSGIDHHPDVGLVGDEYEEQITELSFIAKTGRRKTTRNWLKWLN